MIWRDISASIWLSSLSLVVIVTRVSPAITCCWARRKSMPSISFAFWSTPMCTKDSWRTPPRKEKRASSEGGSCLCPFSHRSLYFLCPTPLMERVGDQVLVESLVDKPWVLLGFPLMLRVEIFDVDVNMSSGCREPLERCKIVYTAQWIQIVTLMASAGSSKTACKHKFPWQLLLCSSQKKPLNAAGWSTLSRHIYHILTYDLSYQECFNFKKYTFTFLSATTLILYKYFNHD